jgi:pyruvate/2-oxoacid:ferredoxin oxidoreductase beta subunit
VIFIPAPCISGWKFEDGQTVEIGLLGARAGVFPVFVWERGKGGSVKDCPMDAQERPTVEEFLGSQRRFAHLVAKHPETGKPQARPGREGEMEQLKGWVQSNVERLYHLAELK